MQIKKIFLFCSVFLIVYNFLYSEKNKILTWKDCLQYAKNNNYDLLISKEIIKQAEQNVLIKKKNLSTKINFSMTANKNYLENDGYSNDSSNINLSKTIFDNRNNYYGTKFLEQTLISNKLDYEDISSNVRLNLRLAFINLFYAQEYLKLSEKIYESRKSNYELVNMNYESGLENKGSFLTAKSDLQESEAEVEKAKLNIEKMRNNLKYYIGVEIDLSSLEINMSFNLTENINEEPSFDKIVINLPAIKKLESQKQGAEYNLKLESLLFTPILSVSASASQNNTKFFSNKDVNKAVGLNLNLPIYEGNVRNNNIKQAKSIYDEKVLEMKNKYNEVFSNLKGSWIELKKSIFDLKIAEESLNAAKIRADIARSKYSIGLVNFDNWIIIENGYINAKKTLLLAQVGTLTQEAKWIQAKGGTLDYDDNKNKK